MSDSSDAPRMHGSEDPTLTGEEGTTQIPRQPSALPTIPGYRMMALLGKGGMGSVFLAEEERLGRRVAIKILTDEHSRTDDADRRFEREARLMATVEHPNVVRVYAFGHAEQEKESLPYLAMEYVEGRTLEDRIQQGTLPWVEAIEIVRQTAEALSAAWRRKIVHRDVKPGNILLDLEGRVRVADFGIAKPLEMDGSLTHPGTSIGTPNYLSPEQATTDDVDFRADIYSLGVVLWECVDGEPPFEDSKPLATIKKHLMEPIPSLRSRGHDVPATIDQLIAQMTAKAREHRHSSYADLLSALDALEEPEPISTSPVAAALSSLLDSSTPSPSRRMSSFAEMQHALRSASGNERGQSPTDAEPSPSPPGHATDSGSFGDEGPKETKAATQAKTTRDQPLETNVNVEGELPRSSEPSDQSAAHPKKPANDSIDAAEDLLGPTNDGWTVTSSPSPRDLTEPSSELPMGSSLPPDEHTSEPASTLASSPEEGFELEPGDDILGEALGAVEARKSVRRSRVREAAIRQARWRIQFEELREGVIKPTLRRFMERLHTRGHPARLQDRGPSTVRLDFALDAAPVVRCRLEIARDEGGKVVFQFSKNLGSVTEEHFPLDEVNEKLVRQQIAAFIKQTLRLP